jgi:protocatechuate 3,4-dioxygenase beta subunit
VIAAVLVVVSLAGAGHQAPPSPPAPPSQTPLRDPLRRLPPEPVGTATIRGRVISADTGTPIRHAQVNLSAVPPPPPATGSNAPPGATIQVTTINGAQMNVITSIGRPKNGTTDAQGMFEFTALPAGSYRLSAQPGQYSAAYLGMAYGAKKPSSPGSSDPGLPIDLADGQVFDKATIVLPRGAVITGRVTDDNGESLARVQVYTVMYLPGSSRGIRTGGNAQTDDLGQFRIFGLTPGDYLVAAEARGNTFVAPNAPPESEDDKIGFMTTYYPTAADEAGAQRVRTRTGAETPGVEIRMVSGRLFHVTGMVIDSSGRGTARVNGNLMKRTAGGSSSSFGFNTDEQGHFQMRNIPPGTYRLTVRQQNPPNAARNPDGSFAEPGEFASLPMTISADVDDILVTTSPGVTITGTVVFENGPPQLTQGQQSFQMRVNATPGDAEAMMGAPTPSPALVGPDLSFTMKGLAGEFLLRSNALGNTLKAVQLSGEDITDTPREFKAGDRVTLVLTSRASTLEGNVTDAAGKPVTDSSLILFSEDKAAWRSNSIRTRRGGTDANGHYRLTGLLPGQYYLVALPRERMNGLTLGTDPSVFEALSKEGTTLVVGEDEQRQVDVKVSVGGGGL